MPEDTNAKKELDFKRLEGAAEYWFDCMAAITDFQIPQVQLGSDLWSLQIQSVMHHFQRNDFVSARSAAEAAEKIQEDHQHYIAKYLLGLISLIINDTATAKRYFNKILALNIKQPLALYYLSVCELRARNYKLAFELLLKSYELQPELPRVNANLSVFYGLFRHYSESEFHAKNALKMNAEVGNGLVSLSKFQADFISRENVEQIYYPFNLDFFEAASLEEAEKLLEQLPKSEIEVENNIDSTALTVFISADTGYFNKYVLSQVLSALEVKKQNINFHLHIINPKINDVSTVVTMLDSYDVGLRVTTESPGLEVNKIYLSSVRFCRLFQYSSMFGGGVLSLDADMLFRTCPYQCRVNADIGFLHFKDEPMWQEISAATLYASGNEESRTFLANLSTPIAKHLLSSEKPGRWFLDQVCMFSAYDLFDKSKAKAFSPTPDYVDLTYRSDSHIWALSNDKDKESEFNKYRSQLEAKMQSLLK